MNIWQKNVEDFHRKYGCPVSEKPTMIGEKDRLRRARLIVSEASEFVESADKGDILGVIDSLCDLLYVLLGTAVEFGVDLEPFFEEIHKSNMTKDGGKDGGGKVLKGKSFIPPDLFRILNHE